MLHVAPLRLWESVAFLFCLYAGSWPATIKAYAGSNTMDRGYLMV